MSDQLLTLEPGARFWFEGDVWEVDRFDGDCVRLRHGATVQSVSTSALLGTATPLDDERVDDEEDLMSTVALSALTVKQRKEIDRRVEQLQPLLGPVPDGTNVTERIKAHAASLGLSVRTLQRRLARVRHAHAELALRHRAR